MTSAPDRRSAASARARTLLGADAQRVADAGARGYLDLLGETEPASTGIGQDLMLSRLLPVVYERWWRPAMGQVAKGLLGPGMAGEHDIAHELLALRAGDVVADVACGPGNFTRDFASRVGPAGLAVGIDASPTMLARAVADTAEDNVAYVRGDAAALPFADSSMDAVCCFAALNLFAEPIAALDQLVRVLKPGGRVALFTSCRRGPRALGLMAGAFAAVAGMTIFERDELVGALRDRGLIAIDQRVTGVTQFVGGRRAG